MASRPHGRYEKFVQDFLQKAKGKRFLEDLQREYNIKDIINI